MPPGTKQSLIHRLFQRCVNKVILLDKAFNSIKMRQAIRMTMELEEQQELQGKSQRQIRSTPRLKLKSQKQDIMDTAKRLKINLDFFNEIYQLK